jgi:hypothetical protein
MKYLWKLAQTKLERAMSFIFETFIFGFVDTESGSDNGVVS